MKAKHREKQKIMLFWGVTAIMVLLLFAETLKDSNVETFGKVHIALTEPGCEERITENFARTVAPGETIEKNPTITLSSGSKPAYLRAKIHFKGLSSSQCGELARG